MSTQINPETILEDLESDLNVLAATIKKINGTCLNCSSVSTSSEIPCISQVKSYVDGYYTLFKRLQGKYEEYRNGIEKWNLFIMSNITNIENTNKKMNDSMKSILSNQIETMKQYRKPINNSIQELDQNSSTSFVFENNEKKIIDIGLIAKYKGSLFYNMYENSLVNDQGDLYIDHNDNNYDLLLSYMKNEPIDYDNMNDSIRDSFLNDLDYFDLPYRNELNQLMNSNKKKTFNEWIDSCCIYVCNQYSSITTDYLKQKNKLKKMINNSDVKSLKYDPIFNRVYLSKQCISQQFIEYYLQHNDFDFSLLKRRCTNDEIVNSFKLIDITLSKKEQQKINKYLLSFIGMSTIIITKELDLSLRTILGSNSQWILKYRASRDGDSAEIFHKLCDTLKTSLILVKVINPDHVECIFGGYTKQSWKEESGSLNLYKEDKDAYLFSLQNPSSYPVCRFKITDSSKAINCFNQSGPIFGMGDLKICDQCLSRSDSSTTLGDIYCVNSEDNVRNQRTPHYSLFVNTNNDFNKNMFMVTDYEVFELSKTSK